MKNIQEAIDNMKQLDRIEFNQEWNSLCLTYGVLLIISVMLVLSASLLFTLKDTTIGLAYLSLGLILIVWNNFSYNRDKNELLSKYLKVKIESKRK